MRIGIVSPAAATRRTGNVHTAQRYAAFLRSAGHRVRLLASWKGEPLDLLIALHARKSADAVLAFARAHPERPIVVMLTGTDLYRDLARSKRAQRALACATRIITLQPDALAHVPRALRPRVTPIVQSATAPARVPARRDGVTQFAVLGHLRAEKDPLRAAYALRRLSRELPMRVVQAGAALDERYLRAAEGLAARDARYRYLGERTHASAIRLLAQSTALVLSSKMEGGANVLCEAIAMGIPVLASRISGNLGILGRAYPGYFPVGDTDACSRLMRRCVEDRAFVRRLRTHVRALRPLVAPRRERRLLLAVVAACAR
ncbi:MAG: TIGR04348 family glycosyltransferase [bacterium]|nr:TIGR04348 family glycosyltransferase [bacterium]